jgi:hypothetical protein
LDGVDSGGALRLKLSPEELQEAMQQQQQQMQQQQMQQQMQAMTGGMQIQHEGRDSVTGKPIMKIGDGPIPDSLPELRPGLSEFIDSLDPAVVYFSTAVFRRVCVPNVANPDLHDRWYGCRQPSISCWCMPP